MMGEHHPSRSPAVRGRLAFLLLVVLYAVSVAQAFVVGSSNVECSNPPPGFRKIFRGVDITRLDLVPLSIVTSDGFKSPVINFTCNGNRSYIRGNPGEGTTTSYQMPDQVWHVVSAPGGWLSADVQLYKTSSDVRTSMKRKVGGEGSYWKFSFSRSRSYSRMQHTITNSTRYISDTSAFESANRVELFPDLLLQLNSVAQLYINTLIGESTYQANPHAYQRFINQFGTHYFAKANFGGFIRMVHETSTNYFFSHTDQQAKNNAKASFAKFISLHGGSDSASTTVETQFTELSQEMVKYYGGFTNLLTSNGIQSWQTSVDDDPWLFSGELKPISDLMRNPVQKSGMEEAVLQHLMRSYLVELRRLVSAVRAKLSGRTAGAATIDALEARIDAMEAIALGALVEAAVDALGDDVKRQLSVPAWFTDNTRLCYKWRPDGDGGQCGGGAARQLCATTGGMTPVYRDDTDGRGGGCRMQWAIQSSGFDAWFSQVQICYRWHPDGHGGQCGGGAARLLCAPVNRFSSEYRDDTDGRGGGCQMSWRIVVPSSAPVWMLNTQLCFSWYPDGDGGQCGPAQSRNMCASANNWTPYYRDDTDGRGGGCRMRWGLKLSF